MFQCASCCSSCVISELATEDYKVPEQYYIPETNQPEIPRPKRRSGKRVQSDELPQIGGKLSFEMSAFPNCKSLHVASGEQSQRFGGTYIYSCRAGLIFITSPIITTTGAEAPISHTHELHYVTAGPFLSLGNDECVAEICDKLCLSANDSRVVAFIETMSYTPPDRITHIANMLFVLGNHLSGNEYNSVLVKGEQAGQQQQINEYIQQIKAQLVSESQGYINYPYDKEKMLFHAIVTGNLMDARSYLNEILGHIFFSSANNLETIKVRAMELAVMISRAALDSGADANKIFVLNMQFITEFFSLSTIEDVCYSLNVILKKFSSETFDLANVKHVDLLSKAVSYIKTHYMHKVTLEEVAAHVYLSPSYFSKIFKEEMKCHFNTYLNSIRIEKSKVLLVAENIGIIDVAELVGYFDQSYFNKVFKKHTGVTPKKFKDLNGQIPYTSVELSEIDAYTQD